MGIVRTCPSNNINHSYSTHSYSSNSSHTSRSPYGTTTGTLLSPAAVGVGVIMKNTDRPHFNVFVVHDPPKVELSPHASSSRHRASSTDGSYPVYGSSSSGGSGVGTSGSGTIGSTSANINIRQNKSTSTTSTTANTIEKWPEGEAGVEILNVIEGRQNCFEAIIIFLIVLISYEDPLVIRSMGQGAAFQRMLFDIFKVVDWSELEILLNLNNKLTS